MKFTETKFVPQIPSKYSSLTQPERARLREEYVKIQKGNCWFCKSSLSEYTNSKIVCFAKLNMNLFPSGFLRYPIHLHHNHDNDLTLGAVHSECNAYMWQYLGQ